MSDQNPFDPICEAELIQELAAKPGPHSKALVVLLRRQATNCQSLKEVRDELIGNEKFQRPGLIKRVGRIEKTGIALVIGGLGLTGVLSMSGVASVAELILKLFPK